MFFENKPFRLDKAPNKTGVIYHKDMLKHRWSNDFER